MDCQENENFNTECLQSLVQLAKKENMLTENLVDFAKRRTELSENRTILAQKRTDFAENRAGLSQYRTDMAKERTDLAGERTDLSNYRTILAKGRTELAFIRTGLALIALGSGMMRYFGLGIWTILDGGLVAGGIAAAVFGIIGYMATAKYETRYSKRLIGNWTASES